MRGLWWVLALVLVGGCGTSGGGSARIPEGMPLAVGEVRYRFEKVGEGSGFRAHQGEDEPTPNPLPLGGGRELSAVRVSMMVMGGGERVSRLAIAPEWGGVRDCARFVQGLEVRDGEGRACAVKREGPGWEVEHEPDAVLTATYELRTGDHDPWSQFGTHYEPVVKPDVFALIGETGLIYPEWLEDRAEVDVGVEWVGWDGWRVVSSFSEGQSDGPLSRVHRPLSEFRHGMFMAGREGTLRVVDRDVKGGVVRVAVYGADWQFADGEMADLVARIVGVEREFTKDFGDPYFLVTVVPTGPRAEAKSVSMGGTGLTDCFALFMAPGSAVAEGTPHQQRVLHLLAHEYFHTWNGGEIRMMEPPPEQLVYWFSEGFTDFYASRLLLRAGLIDDAAWMARLNESLQALCLSPVATAPATQIEREFWTNAAVRDLPYKRGEAVAVCMDEEIRRVSGGKKCLDDFFLEVLRDARAGEKVDTDRLLTRLERWTSAEFAAGVRTVVVEGALPRMPERLSVPRAERVEKSSYRWDIGFDVDGSVKAKVVSGVREGSAAYAAGLRDGMTLAGLSVYHGDPEKEAMVAVKEGGEKREIRYWPRGEGVRVVGYRLERPSGTR